MPYIVIGYSEISTDGELLIAAPTAAQPKFTDLAAAIKWAREIFDKDEENDLVHVCDEGDLKNPVYVLDRRAPSDQLQR